MASYLTVSDSKNSLSAYVLLQSASSTDVLSASEIHMGHDELDSHIPCLRIGKERKKTIIPSAVFAANLLFEDRDQKIIRTTEASNVEKLTLVVEREIRGLNGPQTGAAYFTYRVTVHTRFSTSGGKGVSSTDRVLKVEGQSDLLMKGPYAETVENAISAFEADIVRKLQIRSDEPEKMDDEEWVMNALTKGTDTEVHLPWAVWAGLNVRVSSQGVADTRDFHEESMCPGEFRLSPPKKRV